MGADEYYDAIGDVLSYVLSAGNKVWGQGDRRDCINFLIVRDNETIELIAEPNTRFFRLESEHRVSGKLIDAYESETQLLRGHLTRYEIDDTKIGDEHLHDHVAYRRIRDIDEADAEEVLSELQTVNIHSDCRLQKVAKTDPTQEDSEATWDGVKAISLLYPYESDFGPRDYERAAQEVISVGNQVEKAISGLDVVSEVGQDK